MGNSNIITVDFHGDQLVGIEEGDNVAVALKPIVEGMGLAWHGQYERLKRDPILASELRVTRIPSAGGPQEAICLPVDLVPGFLFRIDATRIKKDDVRAKVLTYQRECYRVLNDAFQGGRAKPKDAKIAPSMDRARKLVAEARQTHGEYAARQLWIQLGLPTVPAILASPSQADLFGANVGRQH